MVTDKKQMYFHNYLYSINKGIRVFSNISKIFNSLWSFQMSQIITFFKKMFDLCVTV